MKYFNIYFSPTGGTLKVSNIISKALTDNFINIDLCKKDNNVVLTKDDICIISVPSYGGRVVSLAANRLKNIVGNGAIAIICAVYGNRDYDDTLVELYDILSDNGFKVISAIAAVAQHSIFPMYGANRPNEKDEIQLIEFAKKIKKKIFDSDLDFKLDGNHYNYKPYNGPSLIPNASSNCILCYKCVKECPNEAISIKEKPITNKEKCIGCMRCVYICQVHARDFDKEMMDEKAKFLKERLGGYKENYLFI